MKIKFMTHFSKKNADYILNIFTALAILLTPVALYVQIRHDLKDGEVVNPPKKVLDSVSISNDSQINVDNPKYTSAKHSTDIIVRPSIPVYGQVDHIKTEPHPPEEDPLINPLPDEKGIIAKRDSLGLRHTSDGKCLILGCVECPDEIIDLTVRDEKKEKQLLFNLNAAESLDAQCRALDELYRYIVIDVSRYHLFKTIKEYALRNPGIKGKIKNKPFRNEGKIMCYELRHMLTLIYERREADYRSCIEELKEKNK